MSSTRGVVPGMGPGGGRGPGPRRVTSANAYSRARLTGSPAWTLARTGAHMGSEALRVILPVRARHCSPPSLDHEPLNHREAQPTEPR